MIAQKSYKFNKKYLDKLQKSDILVVTSKVTKGEIKGDKNR